MKTLTTLAVLTIDIYFCETGITLGRDNRKVLSKQQLVKTKPRKIFNTKNKLSTLK